MSFIYSMLDTWNAGGTTFNAIYMNISNGAGGAPVGAAASRALRLDANGTSIFDVDISGNLTSPSFKYSNTASLTIPVTRVAATGLANSVLSTGSGVLNSLNLVAVGVAGSYVNLFSFGTGLNVPGFIGYGAGGTSGAPAAVASGGTIFAIGAAGFDTSAYGGSASVYDANMQFVAQETSAVGAHGTKIVWQVTPVGTVAIATAMTLWGSGALSLQDNSATEPGFFGSFTQFSYNKVVARTVASLPTPASAGSGARMFVSDANVPVIFTTVAGGGALPRPVFSNGANWLCG